MMLWLVVANSGFDECVRACWQPFWFEYAKMFFLVDSAKGVVSPGIGRMRTKAAGLCASSVLGDAGLSLISIPKLFLLAKALNT